IPALRHKPSTPPTNGSSKPKAKDLHTLEREFSERDKINFETDVLEVWFSGCHCDVGGGSVANDVPHNVARIPLRWMIRQCFLSNTGIRFHSDLLPALGLDPAALWPKVLSRPKALSNADIATIPVVPSTSADVDPSTAKHDRMSTSETLVNYADVQPAGPNTVLTEEQEDLLDIRCEIYDQLTLAPAWWVLEVLPLRHKVQQETDYWASEYYFNLGRGRQISEKHQQEGVHVHRTVKTRMDATDLKQGKYTPKAIFDHKKIIWED
ncbi:hypothetical protein EUX98_g9732, partial [Antrodiella citrinella]